MVPDPLFEPWRIVRSARRTMALHLTQEGELEIRLPLAGFPESAVWSFVERHRTWVIRQRKKIRNLRAIHQTEEGFILYQGRRLELKHDPRLLSGGAAEENILWLGGHPERLRTNALNFLKNRARTEIPEVIEALARRHQLEPYIRKVRITDTRSRWGSCSARGTVSLSWRLIMAPVPVMAYVVLHELAHFRHMNHSDAFWQTVAQFDPDYPAHEQWLNENTLKLQMV